MTAACGSRTGVAAKWWPSTWMVEARWSLLAAPGWVGPSTGCPTAGSWSPERNSLGSSRTAPPYVIAPKGGNELVVDPAGHVYLDGADFDFLGGGAPEPGWIRLIDADGTAHEVAGDIDFPNGMVITPDGSTLVIAESFAGRLSALDIASDGSLSSRRIWADRLGPDGICIDAGGGIWPRPPTPSLTHRIRALRRERWSECSRAVRSPTEWRRPCPASPAGSAGRRVDTCSCCATSSKASTSSKRCSPAAARGSMSPRCRSSDPRSQARIRFRGFLR